MREDSGRSPAEARLDSDDQEEEGPHFGWLDVVAFTIAAYQVILPILGAMLLVLLAIYGLVWLLAH